MLDYLHSGHHILAVGQGVVRSRRSRIRASNSMGSLLSDVDLPATLDENTFVDRGGPVLATARVQLIFWGESWTAPAGASPAAVLDAITQLVAGPYMTGLAQYRNIGSATVDQHVVISAPVAPLLET